MKIFSRKSITLFMVLMLSVMTVGSVSALEPANEDFQRTWERTDKPVADLTVSRTWMWGPEANTGAMMETYAESPGGQREVQYYDKARMEINHPDAERDLWYVTNGLLVVEMITGQMQMGDNTFNPINPAGIPVAGDADDTEGPTYAALAQLLDDEPLDEGAEVSWRVDKSGNVSTANPLTGHGVTAAYWDEETNHTVASVFWDFMNSEGIVWEDGAYVTDQLFENPFYATGRPVTEAYWATVKVAGEVQGVLLQCFERRCLTYTPQNEDGWKVEAGNVGQHYFTWRYEHAQTQTATVFFVETDEEGNPVGCGDPTLVGVEVSFSADADPIFGALTALFAFDERNVGDDQLYNALHQSDLTGVSVSLEDGHATVDITGDYAVGGICDEPRFVDQITETVLNFESVTSADIFINDIPLEDLFSQM